MSFTITSAFRWWAREAPERIALSVDGQTVTYGELWDWTARVGARARDLGVRPGDRICIMGVNSLPFAVLMLGLMRVGGVSAPLNFRSSGPEIGEVVGSLQPTLFFADADRIKAAGDALGAGSGIALHCLDEIEALRSGPPAAIDHFSEPDDLLFIIGTSGSTGRPKGVIYSHRTVMTWAAEFALMEPHCGNGGSFLSLGPFSSASGTLHLMELIGIGNTIFIETRFDPARALDLLVRNRITTFIGVPVFFERIAALPEFADADLSGLRFAQTAGARVAPSLLSAWREKGVVLRQAYGCTEAGGAWAARDDTALSEPEKCGHGGIFTDFAIKGAGDGFAPPGEVGEILVRSPCVTPGYWNSPDTTREAIRDGWLHTGDLGVLDAEGNLTFIDRLKDIIISGGLNISAMEVERVIGALAGVEEVAVIAIEDAEFGETPLAIIHGSEASIEVDAVIEHCRAHLSGFKVPRYVVVESTPLPRIPAGKISKVALREKYRDAAPTLKRLR